MVKEISPNEKNPNDVDGLCVLVFQPVGSNTSSPLQPSKCNVFQSLENTKYKVGRYDGVSDIARKRKIEVKDGFNRDEVT